MKKILFIIAALAVVAAIVVACNPFGGVSDADKAVTYMTHTGDVHAYLCPTTEGVPAAAFNSLQSQIQGVRASWGVYQQNYTSLELPELAAAPDDEALAKALDVECGIARAAYDKALQLSDIGERASTEDRVFVYDMADFANANTLAIGTDATTEFEAAKKAVDTLVAAENEFTVFYAKYGSTTDTTLKGNIGNALEYSRLARAALKARNWEEATKQAGYITQMVKDMIDYVSHPTATPTIGGAVTRQPNVAITPSVPAGSVVTPGASQPAVQPTFTPIGVAP